jgi:periplasmic divalent cation tolerance protein
LTDKIVVLSTCDSHEGALKIARGLVERRLAACVNIVPGATSVYWWQGKLEEAAEWLLVIKSSRPLFDRLQAEIARLHSYEVPEVIALAVVDGSEKYLGWLDRELRSPSAP